MEKNKWQKKHINRNGRFERENEKETGLALKQILCFHYFCKSSFFSLLIQMKLGVGNREQRKERQGRKEEVKKTKKKGPEIGYTQ